MISDILLLNYVLKTKGSVIHIPIVLRDLLSTMKMLINLKLQTDNGFGFAFYDFIRPFSSLDVSAVILDG